MLQVYLKKFLSLKVDRSKGYPAPHKPVLLLAILQMMDQGLIRDNQIAITPELVLEFKDLFHILADPRATSNFALPFYHLKSSGFWHLRTCAGAEIVLTSSHSIKSFSQLKQVVAYAYFDTQLFELLIDPVARAWFQSALMQKYFPGKTLNASVQPGLFDTISEQILSEPAFIYQNQVATADEEELFVRGGVFKRVVPAIYNHTCCISGMRVTVTRSVQMIDACHIVPFSESRNDTISNGISLCPNLHRAFDRFLITIDSDYRMRMAKDVIESGPFGLAQFEGKEIMLPEDRKYWPGKENFEWHWGRFEN